MTGEAKTTTDRQILVVTEDPLYGELLKYGLVASGFAARSVEAGPPAQSAVQDDPPDVILLDIFMAVTDGFRFLHWIRDECRQQIPVIVVVTAEDRTLMVEVMVAGATDVFDKPVSFPEILTAVAGVLDSDATDSNPFLSARPEAD